VHHRTPGVRVIRRRPPSIASQRAQLTTIGPVAASGPVLPDVDRRPIITAEYNPRRR
jgi:hypothetical protein